jgi:putative flippase GtrA
MSGTPLATKVKELGPKYSAVSVVNVIVGQSLLLFFHSVLHLNATLANAVSVCISSVPAYYLSRAWVWGKSGKSHFQKEVLPFWIFVAVGLVFSTAMVALVSHLTGTAGTPAQDLTTVQKLIPNLVNMFAFGLLWVLRFFLMDKLFETHPELMEELIGEDFIEAVEGPDAVAAAEAAAEARRHPGSS